MNINWGRALVSSATTALLCLSGPPLHAENEDSREQASWPASLDFTCTAVAGHRFLDDGGLALQGRVRTGLLLAVQLGTDRWLLMAGPMLQASNGPSFLALSAGAEVELSSLWGPWFQLGSSWTFEHALTQLHAGGGMSLVGVDLALGWDRNREPYVQLTGSLRIPLGAIAYLINGDRGVELSPFPYQIEESDR